MVTKDARPNYGFCSGLSKLSKEQVKTKKCRHFPLKVVGAQLWDKMCIDLIGPFTIKREGRPDLVYKCITMSNPASDWLEVHPYDDIRSVAVVIKAEQEWFF